MSAPDPLATPNCPICLRLMELVESPDGVLMWSCGYGRDETI